MTRKQFIEQQGATCRNWSWSWSFINEKEKVIIFGSWDYLSGQLSLIMSEDWKFGDKGNKRPGFDQSMEHIRLIEEESYQLKTFSIHYSDKKKNKDGLGPSAIGSFTPKLEDMELVALDGKWYASSISRPNPIAEEVTKPESLYEGASKIISVNSYERNAKARAKCIEHYGCRCMACSFDFEAVYGDIGKDYIHVHHVKPLSTIGSTYEIDPIKDLVPVCPNCHAMIHRVKEPLSIEQLKTYLQNRRND